MSDLTHYEGCYTEHHECALALIQRLRDDRSTAIQRAEAAAERRGLERAAKVCEEIGKDIVCPEECAAVIRDLPSPVDSGMVMVPREPTEDYIDKLAIHLCKALDPLPADFDDFISPSRKRWMRYRTEARECHRAIVAAHEGSDA